MTREKRPVKRTTGKRRLVRQVPPQRITPIHRTAARPRKGIASAGQ